eukprot:scaffold27353_cov18-Tisochrysis_lutea.AAC.1
MSQAAGARAIVLMKGRIMIGAAGMRGLAQISSKSFVPQMPRMLLSQILSNIRAPFDQKSLLFGKGRILGHGITLMCTM